MPVQMSVELGEEVQAFAKKLRDAGQKELRNEFAKALRQLAKPLVQDVRQAALKIAMSGSRRSLQGNAPITKHSLRKKIAAATSSRINLMSKKSVLMIELKPAKKLPPEMLFIPKYINEGTAWSHPVFGRGETTQKAVPGFFSGTLQAAAPTVRVQIRKALDEFTTKME